LDLSERGNDIRVSTANSNISSIDFAALFLKQAAKQRSPFAWLFRLAAKIRRLRKFSIEAVCRFEGGQMWSVTYRELMLVYYGVTIGKYSYGPSLLPYGMPEGTQVGNY
jgi:hypothetical protein